ncbi:HepT-like ribonuclease domain-containing protein [Roseiflexus sp. RS-1]|jgi:uncharacterized protein with HEPN domain|uniref:HepT-like ribonuclease domain-containing protein n=1 Tax=Roseiflexus sp. (strain RS-1) TaxID=357808 RepID=UPI0000D80EF7|nr:DUF86 domain-containing protein [Roseiflexus sp. RS-1]ABQ91915.1 protein of unknown function DUF86 [Roseiflexus sp. RS-1]
MSRNVLVYIKDILQNMRDAEQFIQGMTYEQFVADKKTVNAILRSIEVIGEAAKRVPDDVRAQYPQIPWKEMAGMRDKVIHLYFSVDNETVWLVVKERIPSLQPLIEQIVRDLEDQGT